MKFEELNQQLDEVRMAQSNLQQFLNSPRAAGMRAGFEAELIFAGAAYSIYDNVQYVDDMSEDQSTHDIDSIIEFFSQNDYDSHQIRRLRNQLWNNYTEWRDKVSLNDFRHRDKEMVKLWLEDNGWDVTAKIEEYLRDEMGLNEKQVSDARRRGNYYADKIDSSKQQQKFREADKDYDNFLKASFAVDEKLDELVEEEVEFEGKAWQAAYDEWRDEDDYDQEHWLEANDYHSMSSIQYDYDVNWPFQIEDEDSDRSGYSYEEAEALANSLHDDLEVQTKVASSYHAQTKDGVSWYFEPDGSLRPDDETDMPCEIVSPPLPLKETHDILPLFFQWVDENEGYANKSTGFHMSLSMPDHKPATVDFLKLALFMGDEYVLTSFSRQANEYCESSLDIIRNRLTSFSSQEEITTRLDLAFSAMRKNLLDLASKAVNTRGQGKFVSINDRGNYIEFRSAGGSNYFSDINLVQNTLLRYAYAMSIASDPAAERQEYAKKLYKFLAPAIQSSPDAMQYFVKYTTGQMTRPELVSAVKQVRTQRQKSKRTPDQVSADQDNVENYWQLRNTSNGNTIAVFSANNRADATQQALARARQSSGANLETLPAHWEIQRITDAPPQRTPQDPSWPFDSAPPP